MQAFYVIEKSVIRYFIMFCVFFFFCCIFSLVLKIFFLGDHNCLNVT